jgi:hypothetical protein
MEEEEANSRYIRLVDDEGNMGLPPISGRRPGNGGGPSGSGSLPKRWGVPSGVLSASASSVVGPETKDGLSGWGEEEGPPVDEVPNKLNPSSSHVADGHAARGSRTMREKKAASGGGTGATVAASKSNTDRKVIYAQYNGGPRRSQGQQEGGPAAASQRRRVHTSRGMPSMLVMSSVVRKMPSEVHPADGFDPAVCRRTEPEVGYGCGCLEIIHEGDLDGEEYSSGDEDDGRYGDAPLIEE